MLPVFVDVFLCPYPRTVKKRIQRFQIIFCMMLREHLFSNDRLKYLRSVMCPLTAQSFLSASWGTWKICAIEGEVQDRGMNASKYQVVIGQPDLGCKSLSPHFLTCMNCL